MKDKPNYIVIISAIPFPYGNASDNAIYTFMDGFQEHGCGGEVLCLFPNSPADHSDIEADGEYLGVKYRYLTGYTVMPKSWCRHFIDFWVSPGKKLRKHLKNLTQRYNVVALFVAYLDYRIYRYTRICRSLGISTVMVTCEYPIFLVNNPSLVRKWAYRFFSRFIDKYIFETKTLRDYETGVLGRKINSIVIPATMPFEDILKTPRGQRDPYLAYSGSIHSESKDGLGNIIKAYDIFHRVHPEMRLMFIGRMANRAYYEHLIRLVDDLGLGEYVSFTGEVSRESYIHYLKDAEMMIVAKPKDSYYGGGLSSKVIEYLFSGNPVIMVAADDYVHYLTHKVNVFFTEDNKPETLSSAMVEMYVNPEMRRRIGQAGREYALKNFNYHILTKDLLDFVLK